MFVDVGEEKKVWAIDYNQVFISVYVCVVCT